MLRGPGVAPSPWRSAYGLRPPAFPGSPTADRNVTQPPKVSRVEILPPTDQLASPTEIISRRLKTAGG